MSIRNPQVLNPRFAWPRSAYLHVPFCRHRCGYCNFTLVAGRDDLIDGYLTALDRELSLLETAQPVETLYFGGGTPSHLPPEKLVQLMETANRWFCPLPDSEITVEMNPLDSTPERLNVLKAAGVTRVSLGVQSFDDRWLNLLERDHRREDILRAAAECRIRFSAVSLDLIFGLPGQTLVDWELDLEAAVQLAPQHLSVYGLTFERGTRFWSRLHHAEWQPCPEEEERRMYETAIDFLTAAGFEHYEVSNFARPGQRSRHNETYWLGRTYFGSGPGAARHIAGRRELNHRSTTTYLKRVLSGQSPVAESELLSDEDSARERFVFGLRRLQGIDEETYRLETGFTVEELFQQPIEFFVAQGLLQRSGGNIRLTRAGLLVSDSLWPSFLN